jgi:Glycerophosphoryl diester phosphodiesterase family
MFRRSQLWVVASALSLACAFARSQTVDQEATQPPLIHAHAHNDYEHTHPLFDALSHGFASVEADIHLVDGQLLVAHNIKEVVPGRTLQSLYLDPLRARAARYGGRIYTNGESVFYLLIDTKTETNATYAVLRRVLQDYSDLLTGFSSQGVTRRAVTVVLSGNRPREMLAREPERLAGLDGEFSDLGKPDPKGLLLWVSDNWSQFFTWQGEGSIPAAEREKVRQIVRQAHDLHAKARFWGAPDTPAFWRELREDGVDLINTDDLAGAEKFLRGQPPFD